MTKLAVLLCVLVCLAGIAQAQTPVSLAPVFRQQFFDTSGRPLAGGCVFFYQAGTSIPQAIYADSSGTFAAPNPTVLDAGGFGTFYLTNNSYRVVLFSAGGVNCASGQQQWAADNVNPFSILNTAGNLFLAPTTVDPPGSVGELGYRSDLAQFRGFTSLWDSFLQNANTATVTNKTFDISANILKTATNTIGHYPRNNGTQYVDSPLLISDATFSLVNCSPISMVSNSPAILSTTAGAPCGIFAGGSNSQNGVIGFCVSNCGGAGLIGIVQQYGTTTCIFDNTTVVADYVLVSFTNAGQCHDAGALLPPGGVQTIGRVLTSGTGTQSLLLFGPEIRQGPGVVYATSLGGNASSGLISMIASTASTATYRFSAYATQSSVGASCASNPLITITLSFQDPNAAGQQTPQVGVWTITGNGTVGNIPLTTTPGTLTFRAKVGTAISYATTYTALTSCAPIPGYQIFPILEQVTQN